MRFSVKCNSGRIAIQWFHIKHYLDYQYTKFKPYIFRVQKICVFARYATLVPRLIIQPRRLEAKVTDQSHGINPSVLCLLYLLKDFYFGELFFTLMKFSSH